MGQLRTIGHRRPSRRIGARSLPALLGLLLLALALPAAAPAAVGDLTWGGCVAGQTEIGPSGAGACDLIPGATSEARGTGLYLATSTSVSPEGNSLYVGSFGSSAVSVFSRAADGTITYQDCVSGNTELGPSGTEACELIPSAQPEGENSGLGYAATALVSPDGRSVYVAAAGDAAIATFSREPGSGALTYQGCISGSIELGPTGTEACELIPKATASGQKSGVFNIYSVALSADGRSLYTSSRIDDSVATFSRDPETGALTYEGCISGNTELGPSGTEACELIPKAQPEGEQSGLDQAVSVAASPDGASVYAAGATDASVARFDRNPLTGALTYQGCISGNTELGPSGTEACELIPSAQPGGEKSGLYYIGSLVVSPDDASLYTGAQGDSAVAMFSRNGGGSLSYYGCISGSEELGPSGTGSCSQTPVATATGRLSGLGSPGALAISPDGRSVYAQPIFDVSIVQLNRSGTALTYGGCLSGATETGPAGNGACALIPTATSEGPLSGMLHSLEPTPSNLAISPDGTTLYSAASNDHAIARFAREIEPAPVPSPEPAPAPGPEPATSRPDNRFSIHRLVRRKLLIRVRAAGRLKLTDAARKAKRRRVRAASKRVAGASRVRLPVRLNHRGKRILRKRGSVVVRVRIRFVPSGGKARTKVRRLKIVR